jgi:hypothetical protein
VITLLCLTIKVGVSVWGIDVKSTQNLTSEECVEVFVLGGEFGKNRHSRHGFKVDF